MYNRSNYMASKSIYTKRLQSMNTEQYYLDELKDLVDYPGNMAAFRVLCWRLNIPFKKGFRGQNKNIHKLITEGYDFSKYTLQEIKKLINYKGGMDGLISLLRRHNIKFMRNKNSLNKNKEKILNAIRELDTANMTPIEIVRTIGIDIVNPAQFMRRNNIPYLKRN